MRSFLPLVWFWCFIGCGVHMCMQGCVHTCTYAHAGLTGRKWVLSSEVVILPTEKNISYVIFIPKGRGGEPQPAAKLIIYEQLVLHAFFLSVQVTEGSNYVKHFSLLVLYKQNN